jgi:hypothetical protein
MESFPPPPPSWSPPPPPLPRPPTAKKGAWRVLGAIAVAAVAISIGGFAVFRATSSVPTAAATTTTPVTTTIVSIANPGMTGLQFAGFKSVIEQISRVDISPYEDCIRQAPYSVQMTDPTMMMCVDDVALRLQYIKAALDRSGLIASSPPAYIDCYEAAVVSEEFSARLANPVGVGKEADAWAIDQFTSAGRACSKPEG